MSEGLDWQEVEMASTHLRRRSRASAQTLWKVVADLSLDKEMRQDAIGGCILQRGEGIIIDDEKLRRPYGWNGSR